MTTIYVKLDTIDKVKAFVNLLAQYDTDFDLVSGRYVIDAKSIMGIFSLDLNKPIQLDIHNCEKLSEIVEALKPFTV